MKMFVTELTLPVSGMSCTACASGVEGVLKNQDGVLEASVNYAASTVKIRFNPMATNIAELQTALKPLGYNLVAEGEESEQEFDDLEAKRLNLLRKKLLVSLIFSLPVFVISMLWHHTTVLQQLVLLLLSLPVIFFSGKDFYITAFRLAKIGRTNMDTLVALGTSSAFILSLINTLFPSLTSQAGIGNYVYYESAVVIITLILLGRFLEERSRKKAGSAIKSLAGLQVKQAVRIAGGKEEVVDVKNLFPGDMVFVKPGETFPVDGIITEGSAWVNESMMSGESLPVHKDINSNVLAGTINIDGALKVKTLETGKSTRLARIIKMVNEARNSKAKVQLLVDKISTVFVPVVMAVSILTFLSWLFLIPGGNISVAIATSISVLIIACPCALGLATPTALIAAIGNGAGHGILFRDASGLEMAGKIDALVIDKTGTLTTGMPSINTVYFPLGTDELVAKKAFMALTSRSAHPLSMAIAAELRITADFVADVNDFKNIPGVGMKGSINGEMWYAGSISVFEIAGFYPDAGLTEKLNQFAEDPSSMVVLCTKEKLYCVALLGDTLREDAADAVKRIKNMGIELHMLTGDHKLSAEQMAEKAGIDSFRFNMSPEGKSEYINALRSRGMLTAMVGDGINDTIALAAADVGIAVGGGSDASREAAAVALTGTKLMLVADTIALSRKTNRIIKENLFWAFGYNVIAIPIAAGVLLPLYGILLNPMIASAAMAFSSVSVVLNSLRLRD